MTQRLLNPASALFREGSLLLREESGVTDTAPYHGVLAAIAAGAALPATVAYREHRQGHEIDVVVVEASAGARRRVMAIGEVTSTARPVDVAEITRLDHLRDLLPDSWMPAPPRLLVFSRVGFTSNARRSALSRQDVELVDLERLYRSD